MMCQGQPCGLWGFEHYSPCPEALHLGRPTEGVTLRGDRTAMGTLESLSRSLKIRQVNEDLK